jgi:hypothetical protein
VASIVTCPGCQKRLKLGTDKPGGKLRCPACNTPFVLGSRTNEGASGPAEFLAFELFEENFESEFEVIEDKPAKPIVIASKPPARPVAPPAKSNPIPPPALKTPPKPPQPPPQPAKKKEVDLLGDDVDLLGVGPVKTSPAPPPQLPEKPTISPEPSATPSNPEPQESILPDDFTGISDEWRHTVRMQPAEKSKPKTEPKPKVESKNEPRPSPKPVSKNEDFFLPANFDLSAFAASPPKSSPIPDLSLNEPPAVEFEVIDTSPRVAADGVPIIEGATAEDLAVIQRPPRDYEEITDDPDYRPRNRAERRQKRMRKAVRQAMNADVRGRWAMVFWGITFEFVATVCFGIAIALVVVSMVAFLLGAVLKSGPLVGISTLIWVLILGLTALSGVLDLFGRGLSMPCPAKNNAMIWAILSAALGLAGVVGLLPLTLVGQIFYLVFLKFAAEALKEYSLAEECLVLIKLVIATAIVSILLFAFVIAAYLLGVATVATTRDSNDASTLGWIMFALSLIFVVVEVILCAVVTYKYFEILSEFRHELRWRLES